MEHQVRNLTALGLLVIVATGLFIWGFFFLMGDPILVGGDEIVVAMTNGAGLNRGDAVQLNGVQVGAVRRVHLEPPNRVTVSIKIDDNIRLPADTRALVAGDMFGKNTVQLIPGSALVPLEGGDTIQGMTQRALPALASELGDQARDILTAADSLLSPDAVSNLKATAAVLPDAAAQLRSAFAELTRTASALRRTAEQLERANAGANAGEALAEVRNSARSADETLAALRPSLESMASVMAKLDQGHGTLGRLINDTTLYGDLSATLREFRALATDVRQNPGRYVKVSVF